MTLLKIWLILVYLQVSLSEMSSQFVINENMPSEQASSFTFVLLITQLTWKRVCSIDIYRVLGPGLPLFSCLWVFSIVSTTSGSIQRFAPASSTIFPASFDTASFVFSRDQLLWSRFCYPFRPDITLFIVFCRLFRLCWSFWNSTPMQSWILLFELYKLHPMTLCYQ